ncbi:MAG: thioredoxin domain-containing protein, partial [Chlamydiales bacterium]|nr:thioredoxin domain-containing protein [Chlamydiales bacterium]
KVDREELPEIDSIYMEFAQALMASAGGWPLNLLLTPDLKPFFAVTYLPPMNRKGLIGMPQFIEHINQVWKSEEKGLLIDQADKIVEIFEKSSFSTGDSLPPQGILTAAAELLFEMIDPIYGGFKGEPKFPMGYQSLFLLEYAKEKKESRAMFCVELTLDKMLQGGIYDHLGGGFSRYSVDESWQIPHFEKMLYDNVLLIDAYLQAWQFCQKKNHLKTATQTLDYLLREMVNSDGGFYSAEDADTDGHEGIYYTWTLSEIREILSNEQAEIFCGYYGVKSTGNFEGRNVLHISSSIEEFSESVRLPQEEVESILESCRQALFKRRSVRNRPFVDDKVISSWNGLAIHTMAKAYGLLEKEAYGQAACKSAQFLHDHLHKEGRLYRRWRDKEARFNGGIDDYAFLIKGLITLFEQDLGTQWLEWAITLCDTLVQEFKVAEGAFYFHIADPHLLLRRCEFYDGAEPSGNAVHCENLLRLFQITGNPSYLSQAEDILKAAKQTIESYPPGACYHLRALLRYYQNNAPLIVIALDEQNSLSKEIKKSIASHFNPYLSVVWKRGNDHLLDRLVPSLKGKGPIDGQTAVYICRQDRCQEPVFEKEAILQAIKAL